MSRIYAAGVKGTAISNILADMAAFIVTDAAGIKKVDAAGLQDYLRTQFAAISTDGEAVPPADAASAAASAKTVDVTAIVAKLSAAIDQPAWASRSDWPTTSNVLAGGQIVTAVKAGIAACQQASEHVRLYYADSESKIASIIIDKAIEFGLDGNIPAGVTRQVETRSVIYTHVTDWGEESAPSDPSVLVDMDQNDTATYTAGAIPTGRNISSIRWYRSRSSNAGADFAFVAEVSGGTLTYTDSKKAEELAEPCPSLTWAEPPATLAGLTEGANGGMAGFVKNTVHVCENYKGYAWPSEYQKTTAWPIVGIGHFGQTYVVLTRGKPYFLTGADSASLDSRPLDTNQACVARLSIVSNEMGVLYASPDGICVANDSGVKLLTQEYWDRTAWQALTPTSIIAAEYEGCYLFGCTGGTFMLDPRTGKLVTVDITASAFFRDLVTDTLYYATGTTIKSAFTAGTKRTAVWKSKKMVMPRHANLGWVQVDSEFESSVEVKVYRDGTLTDTKTVTSKTPVRLSFKRAIEHEVQVTSAAKVTSITATSTAEELKQL